MAALAESTPTDDRALTEVNEVVVGDDGVMRLYVKTAGGGTTSIGVGVRSKGLILQALLGSTLDPTSASARRFPVAGLARFRSDDDVGLSFLLSREIGMHFVVDRSLAAVLRELIDTFDDAGSWQSAKLN
jgi:hypothetical protein